MFSIKVRVVLTLVYKLQGGTKGLCLDWGSWKGLLEYLAVFNFSHLVVVIKMFALE